MPKKNEKFGTPPAPNAIDLCTVDDVLNYLGTYTTPASDADAGNVQLCITGFSKFVLYRTGMGPGDGSMPTQSPLVEVCSFDEYYDGAGGYRQYTRVRPIVSCSLVQIGLVTVPQSTNIGAPGWVIDQSRRAIVLRTAAGGNIGPTAVLTIGFSSNYGGYRFFSQPNNPQNVRITYTAGFDGVPGDLFEKAVKAVAINYKRKQWLDQKSQAMADGAGTITFRDWHLSPDINDVIKAYSRKAIVG